MFWAITSASEFFRWKVSVESAAVDWRSSAPIVRSMRCSSPTSAVTTTWLESGSNVILA